MADDTKTEKKDAPASAVNPTNVETVEAKTARMKDYANRISNVMGLQGAHQVEGDEHYVSFNVKDKETANRLAERLAKIRDSAELTKEQLPIATPDFTSAGGHRVAIRLDGISKTEDGISETEATTIMLSLGTKTIDLQKAMRDHKATSPVPAADQSPSLGPKEETLAETLNHNKGMGLLGLLGMVVGWFMGDGIGAMIGGLIGGGMGAMVDGKDGFFKLGSEPEKDASKGAEPHKAQTMGMQKIRQKSDFIGDMEAAQKQANAVKENNPLAQLAPSGGALPARPSVSRAIG